MNSEIKELKGWNFCLSKELSQLKESVGYIYNNIVNLQYALGHRTELTDDDIDDLEYIIYDLYTFPTIKMNECAYNGHNEILNCNFTTLETILKEIKESKGHE
jgi:hypothetical protein